MSFDRGLYHAGKLLNVNLLVELRVGHQIAAIAHALAHLAVGKQLPQSGFSLPPGPLSASSAPPRRESTEIV